MSEHELIEICEELLRDISMQLDHERPWEAKAALVLYAINFLPSGKRKFIYMQLKRLVHGR